MPGMDGFINFNGTLEGSIVGGGGGDVTDVKVRDSQETTFESVVNEEGVAEIDLISYVRRNELSQELMRLENDIDNELQRKQNIYNYSTEEQLTGQKWIDGKDIYCKVLDLGSNINFEIGWNLLNVPHENIIENMIKASAIYPQGYSESIGFAFNHETYFEVKCYRPTTIRYIIYYYTKRG